MLFYEVWSFSMNIVDDDLEKKGMKLNFVYYLLFFQLSSVSHLSMKH